MANEENLKPFTSDQNREEAKKNGKKGGVASGQARRKKIVYKKIFEEITQLKLSKDKYIQKLKELYPEATEEQMNYGILSAFRILEKAIAGDTKAFSIVRDTMGQAPVQKQEIINIDPDGYRRVLMDDEDVFAGDYGSANNDEEEENEEE